jgi:hypothetical protein
MFPVLLVACQKIDDTTATSHRPSPPFAQPAHRDQCWVPPPPRTPWMQRERSSSLHPKMYCRLILCRNSAFLLLHVSIWDHCLASSMSYCTGSLFVLYIHTSPIILCCITHSLRASCLRRIVSGPMYFWMNYDYALMGLRRPFGIHTFLSKTYLQAQLPK